MTKPKVNKEEAERLLRLSKEVPAWMLDLAYQISDETGMTVEEAIEEVKASGV